MLLISDGRGRRNLEQIRNMSKRLDQEREKRLEPKRMQVAISVITELGFDVRSVDDKHIEFQYNDETVTYWPYSGWASGKSIKDGRGLKRLISQITKEPTT